MDKRKKKGEAELIDWYEKIPKKFLTQTHNPNFDIHGIKLPFRALLIGGSGAGKTQTLLNLLHNMGNTFNAVWIITKCKKEPLYEFLEEKLGDKGLTIVEGINNAPDLDSLDEKEQTLIVMDDLVLEKNQKPLEAFFIRGRKKNASFVYISQSYFAVPPMIRKNLNYLMIKRLSNLPDLFRIMREYSLGVDKEKLKQAYEYAIGNNKQDFLMVDVDGEPSDRFRKNFNTILHL